MYKYLIHACNTRQWYVDKFIYPSLLKQGIKEEDIYIYQDVNNDGNLVSFVKSGELAVALWGIDAKVWHLQDDVAISSKFSEVAEKDYSQYTAVCGFTCCYDDNRPTGEGTVLNDMWFSFPCIMIPNKIMSEFTQWVNTYVWRDNQFRLWVRKKKYDDLIFKIFLENYHGRDKILNLAPNIVEHVDYLLGGSVVNMQRGDKNVRSMYWEENELIEQLEKEIRAL